MSDVLFVSDMSGYLSGNHRPPIKQLIKIVQWLFNGFKWPYDNRGDMFGQPMIIKYAPKLTTCSFDNAGLTVALPTLGIPSQCILTAGADAFSLNMSCQNVGVNGNSDRNN